jgi:hypothetical protein
VGPGSAGRSRPTLELARDGANPTPGHTVAFRHSGHRMPKAKTAPVKDWIPPLLVPRSRNLQHRPDGTSIDASDS